MDLTHRFHPELRHATAPTYVASYVFPLLLLTYEAYRVGYWIAAYGMNFTNFKQMGYEYLLMLAMFGVQIVMEALFLGIAWLRHHADLGHRLANLSLGLLCSFGVLAFDYLLQVAF
jgi:hypothetical protein